MTEASDARRRDVAAPARTLRTVLPASAAVLLATGAHLAGGGEAPGGGVLLGCVALAALVAHRLSARRWDARTLVGLLVLLQAVVHLACAMPSAAQGAHGDHAAMAPGAEAGPGMLLAHAVATALTTLVLLHGERVLWAALEVLAAGVDRLAPVLLVPAAGPRSAAVAETAAGTDARPRPLVTACALRAPPVPA